MIEIEPNIETKDPWYRKIRSIAESGKSMFYKIENGHVYRRGRYQAQTGDRIWTLCIPNELVNSVLKEKHNDSCHMGYWKTLNSIQRIYYWKGMHASIYKYVTECEVCRQAKHSNENTRVPTGDYRDPIRPGRVLYIDFIGQLPTSRKRNHMFAIVCVDGFSRYVFTRSFVRATAQNAIDFLEKEVLWKFDTPEWIVSDHGKQFTDKAFEQFLDKYRIQHSTTGFYHPQANSGEATNKSIKTSIRAQILEKDAQHIDWADELPFITMKLNTVPLTATHQSPYFTLFGREKAQTGDEHKVILDANPELARTPERMEVIQQAVANQARTQFEVNRRRYDTRATVRKFKIGDFVYIKHREQSSKGKKISSKLNPVKKKAIIHNILGQDTYELIDSQSRSLGKYNAIDIMIR
ncbi:MAG: transposase [Sphingobacteriaceae bacterium]|nr:MAG: transposase [Sphingobacteriaceae bacterium]